jgi:hypothetical protein
VLPLLVQSIFIHRSRYNTTDLSYETYPDTNALIAESDLTHFHTYGLQFNRDYIHWHFDGHKQMSLTGLYSYGILSSPVKIEIALNIGGNEYANQSLGDTDHMEWQCSAIIVDYIRMYDWSESDLVPNTTNLNPAQSVTICRDIMHEIKDEQLPLGKSSMSTMLIILIGIILLLVIALISIIIFVYCKQKRLQLMKHKQESEKMYENDQDIYAKYDYDNDNTYDNYHYDVINGETEVDHDNLYVKVTNRYVIGHELNADIYDDNCVDDYTYIDMKSN